MALIACSQLFFFLFLSSLRYILIADANIIRNNRSTPIILFLL